MTASLSERIKAEFEARDHKVKAEEQARAAEEQARHQRLERFNRACDELRSVWRPRLEEFAKQFGDEIKFTPKITPTQREAKAVFMTDLASINLALVIAPDVDVKKLVLDYDLLIVPMFFEYERHARLEISLDAIQPDAIAAWLDDRLVNCVKAYLAVQDNQAYINRSLVTDPVSGARLLRENAAAVIEHEGKAHYFKTEESAAEFKRKLEIA